MSLWWLVPVAVVIVVVWAAFYIGAFMKDRQRSRDMANDAERLHVDPHGPTSTPRHQQDRDT
jgi:hypothetical protein